MANIREIVRGFILQNFLPGEDPKNLTDQTELPLIPPPPEPSAAPTGGPARRANPRRHRHQEEPSA